MRKLLVALSFLILAGVAGCNQPNDTASIEAVDNAVGKLDEAFERHDATAIKALLTPDHLAVTPYYGTPQTVDEQIASLPQLKYEQTDLSEPKVVLLGPDLAMRTVAAKLDGTFKDKPFSDKVFITAILVKQNGKWLERHYQATQLAP